MEKSNSTFWEKVITSVAYTAVIVFLSMWGIGSLVGLAFNKMSAGQSNTWILICLCIGIIFTIFFCTLTIVDELKKRD